MKKSLICLNTWTIIGVLFAAILGVLYGVGEVDGLTASLVFLLGSWTYMLVDLRSKEHVAEANSCEHCGDGAGAH